MKLYILLALLCAGYALEESQQQPQQFSPQQSRPLDQQQPQLSESGQYYPRVEQQSNYPTQRRSFSYVTQRPLYQDVQKSPSVESNQERKQRQQPLPTYDHVMGQQPQQMYPQVEFPQPQQTPQLQGQVPYHTQTTTHQIIISEVKQLVPQYSGTTIVSIPTNMVGDKVSQLQQHVKENKSQLDGSNLYQRNNDMSDTLQNTKFTTTSESRLDPVTEQYMGRHNNNVATGRTPQHVGEMLHQQQSQQQQQKEQREQQQQSTQDENLKNTRNRRAVSATSTTTTTTTSTQAPTTTSTSGPSTTRSRVTPLVQKQAAQGEFTKNFRNRRAVSTTSTTASTTTSTQAPLSPLAGGHSMAQSRVPHLVQQQYLYQQHHLPRDERGSRAINNPNTATTTTTTSTQSPHTSGQHMDHHHKPEMAVPKPGRIVSTTVPDTVDTTTTTKATTTTASSALSNQQVTKAVRSPVNRGRQYHEMMRSQRQQLQHQQQYHDQNQSSNMSTQKPLQQTVNNQQSTTDSVVKPMGQSNVHEVPSSHRQPGIRAPTQLS